MIINYVTYYIVGKEETGDYSAEVILQMKVCICRGHLTINAICETLMTIFA
jgi:hypothetical protein